MLWRRSKYLLFSIFYFLFSILRFVIFHPLIICNLPILAFFIFHLSFVIDRLGWARRWHVKMRNDQWKMTNGKWRGQAQIENKK